MTAGPLTRTCKHDLLIHYCFGETSNSVRFNSILRSFTQGLRQWIVDMQRRPSLNKSDITLKCLSENAPRETASDVIAERKINQISVLFWAYLFFLTWWPIRLTVSGRQSALVLHGSALMGGIPDTRHAAVNNDVGKRKAPNWRTCDSSIWSSVRGTQSAAGGNRDYRAMVDWRLGEQNRVTSHSNLYTNS